MCFFLRNLILVLKIYYLLFSGFLRNITSNLCYACQPGSRYFRDGNHGNATCLPCDVGTFSSQSAALVCSSCAVNTFTAMEGSFECLVCPDFSTVPSNSFGCICKSGMLMNSVLKTYFRFYGVVLFFI